MKDVSCEYDRWVVETQRCKLRETSDTLIGCACAMLQLKYVQGMVFVNYVYDTVVDTPEDQVLSSTSCMVDRSYS